MIGRIRRLARLVVASGLILGIALGLSGQVVRDRSIAWALLMYLPLVPMGLTAAVFDGICRGRALPRGRFLLGVIGLASAIGAAWPMVGFGPGPGVEVGLGPVISVLHWNVLWGGGKDRDPAKWATIRREILRHPADLVVLSEAPPDDWLDQLVGDLGPGASRVQVENGPTPGYWYKLVVCSKGPLRLVRRELIADGAGVVVEAEVQGRTVRLLVVDARSKPTILRSPRFLSVAAACRRARESGQPIDVVLGDFNGVSRSLGFEAIEGEGYALASRATWGWRGTFPSILPVYDIDHVLVRVEDRLLGCRLFTNFVSDHRGQVVRFRPPD
jgi:endonuclease/exonuclease/phosphatase (EEP) superfamily protein YafD